MSMRISRQTTMIALAVFCVAMLAIGGCASSGGKTYSASEARKAQTVQYGTIKSIQEVIIQGEAGSVGIIGGGAVGGVVGSTIGFGRGRILSSVGGAVVGAVLGAFGERQLGTEQAYEFMVDLDNGSTVSVVQAADDTYSVGDRVRLLYGSGNKVRVVRE